MLACLATVKSMPLCSVVVHQHFAPLFPAAAHLPHFKGRKNQALPSVSWLMLLCTNVPCQVDQQLDGSASCCLRCGQLATLKSIILNCQDCALSWLLQGTQYYSGGHACGRQTAPGLLLLLKANTGDPSSMCIHCRGMKPSIGVGPLDIHCISDSSGKSRRMISLLCAAQPSRILHTLIPSSVSIRQAPTPCVGAEELFRVYRRLRSWLWDKVFNFHITLTTECPMFSLLWAVQASSSCKTWSGQGDAAEGTMQPAIDVDFFIDTDPETAVEMVTISDVKPVRRHGEFLARHISKFEDIIKDLNAPPPAAATATPAARPSGPSAVAAY